MSAGKPQDETQDRQTQGQLEAQLREQPDHHETWLVYADWLTTQGDPRGQLIRLEQRLHTVAMGAQEHHQIQGEIAELVAQHEASWLKGWTSPEGAKLSWRGGFVSGARFVTPTAETVASVKALLGHPVARFLSALSFEGLPDGLLSPVLALLEGSTVRSLEILSSSLQPGAGRVLAESGALARLTHLSLRDNALGDGGIAQLVGAPWLRDLSSLDLGANLLSDAGAESLAKIPGPCALTQLALPANQIGPAGAAALAGSSSLPSLTSLDLHGNVLGDEGARAIAQHSCLPLTMLGLGQNGIGDEGVRALASSARLASLTALSLVRNDITEVGARLVNDSTTLGRGVVRW